MDMQDGYFSNDYFVIYKPIQTCKYWYVMEETAFTVIQRICLNLGP